MTLPQGFTCEKCTLQLLRQAGEWAATGGYVFFSCADISIQDNASELRLSLMGSLFYNCIDFKYFLMSVCNGGNCSGHGTCVGTGGVCQCDRLYRGKFCQFKGEYRMVCDILCSLMTVSFHTR